MDNDRNIEYVRSASSQMINGDLPPMFYRNIIYTYYKSDPTDQVRVKHVLDLFCLNFLESLFQPKT